MATPKLPNFFQQCRASAQQLGMIAELEETLVKLYEHHKYKLNTVWADKEKQVHADFVSLLKPYVPEEQR